MTFSATIDGVSTAILENTLKIDYVANGRSTASFEVKTPDASDLPPLDAEIIITADGVRLFGGLIDRAPKRGFGGGARPEVVTRVTAVDFAAYPDRRIIVDGGFPAGTTLLDALTSLVTWLTPYGVTLDPSQVTGPTLPEILYPLNTVREALDGLVSLTAASGEAFVWEIDAFKVLRMFQPSTLPAPFDILTNAPGFVDGDITVEPTKAGYANRVYVVAAPKSEVGRVESFTGDDVTDTFTLHYTLTAFPYGIIHRYESDGVTPSGGETFGLPGVGAQVEYDAVTNSFTRLAGPFEAPYIYKLTFDGTYTGRAMAQTAEVFTDPWERARTVENVDADDTLQEMAESDLAIAQAIPKNVKYLTREPGLAAGMSQVLDVPARALDETGMVSELSLFERGNRLWWNVTVLTGAQTNVGRGYANTVKGWSSNTSGGNISVGAGGVSATGPAPPDESIQSNQGGRFYGKSSLLFKAEQNSIVAGELSSIDAADYRECFVFAYDGHIAD